MASVAEGLLLASATWDRWLTGGGECLGCPVAASEGFPPSQ